MKYDDDIKSASQVLETFFSGLLGSKANEYTTLDKGWQKVLKTIPRDGEKMASHSEIKEIKNGCLYIQTDHPGWVQLFQLHKKKIMYTLRKEFPSIQIKDFFFLIKEK